MSLLLPPNSRHSPHSKAAQQTNSSSSHPQIVRSLPSQDSTPTNVNPSQRPPDAHIVPSLRRSPLCPTLTHHTTMGSSSVCQKCHGEVPCPRLAGVPHTQRRLDARSHSIIPIFLVFHHKRRKSSLKDIRIKLGSSRHPSASECMNMARFIGGGAGCVSV